MRTNEHPPEKKKWDVGDVYPGAAGRFARLDPQELAPVAEFGDPGGSPSSRRPPSVRLHRLRRLADKSGGIKKVAAYGRMSQPSKNHANAKSALQQIDVCRSDAPRHGLEVVATYTDENVSGRSIEDRPGFKRMIADVQRGGFQGIITADISRLGRTAALTIPLIEQLYRLGIDIFVVGLGKMTKEAAMAQALAAEQSVQYISIATALAMKNLIADGKNATRPPFGYRADPERRGGLLQVASEAAFLRSVAQELLAGKRIAEVVRDINGRGLRTRAGSLWSHQNLVGTLRKPGVLRSAVSAGLLVYNRTVCGIDPDTGKRISDPLPFDEWTVGARPGDTIFAIDEFEALQKVFSHGIDTRRPGPGPSTFLRGRCRCTACGGAMVSSGGGYMNCRTRKLGGGCGDGSSYKRTRIEDLILARVEALLSDGTLDAQAAAEYERRSEVRAAVFRSDLREAEIKLAEIRNQIRNVRDAARAGTLADVWLEEDLRVLRKDEIEAEARFLRLSGDALEVAPDVAAVDRIRTGFADIRKVIAEGEGADLTNEASAALSELVDEVRVYVAGDTLRVSVRGLVAFDEVILRSGDGTRTKRAGRTPVAAND